LGLRAEGLGRRHGCSPVAYGRNLAPKPGSEVTLEKKDHTRASPLRAPEKVSGSYTSEKANGTPDAGS